MDSLAKIGLCVLLVGMGGGARLDANIQFRILADDLDHAEVKLRHRLGSVVFFAVCLCLFFFHEELVLFQALVLLFVMIDAWTFSVLIMDRLEEHIRETEKIARKVNDKKN